MARGAGQPWSCLSWGGGAAVELVGMGHFQRGVLLWVYKNQHRFTVCLPSLRMFSFGIQRMYVCK